MDVYQVPAISHGFFAARRMHFRWVCFALLAMTPVFDVTGPFEFSCTRFRSPPGAVEHIHGELQVNRLGPAGRWWRCERPCPDNTPGPVRLSVTHKGLFHHGGNYSRLLEHVLKVQFFLDDPTCTQPCDEHKGGTNRIFRYRHLRR